MPLASSGSAALPFDVHGAPSAAGAPDVLLIHAGVNDRRAWAPLLDRVTADRRYVAFDARGFGESTYEPEPFNRARDAVAVLDAAGLDRVVLIGNSIGGRTAIDVALDHPERVAALVLIGTAIGGAPQEENDPPEVTAICDAMEAAEEAEDLETLNRLEARFWLDGLPAPEGRVSGAARDLFLAMNGIALAAPETGEEDRTSTSWDRLEEIAVPTLVLVGALDLVEFQDLSARAAARIPGARHVLLEGVAHVPVLEGDPATLQAITDFLESLTPTP